MPRAHSALGRLECPATALLADPLHRRVQPDAVGQAEPLHPGLAIGQDLRLQRARERQVAQRPIGRADLDVLPAGQVAPQAADPDIPFEGQGIQSGTARVVQCDHARQPAADDGYVQGWVEVFHGEQGDEAAL